MERDSDNVRGRPEAGSDCARQLFPSHTFAQRAFALLFVGTALLTGGCAAPRPPAELAGLWSPSLLACAAGLGVTFRADAVRAKFGGETMVLLGAPQYQVRPEGAGAVVRIEYNLPAAPGGVNPALGRGVVEVERTPAGRLVPKRAWFFDRQTGTARTALTPGPVESALDLGLCPPDMVLKQQAPETASGV
jgi:hypothetical protein